MSIAQFYRTPIPMVKVASYRNEYGDNMEVVTPIVQPLGNTQPYKNGLVQNNTSGGLVFNSFWIVYLKNLPEWDWSGAEGADEDDLNEAKTYVMIDGEWYSLVGQQDWTKAGRGVKHWKLFCEKLTSIAIPNIIKDLKPIPLRSLVTRWDNEINELTQVTKLIIGEES